jgi:hypothetical protein
MGEVQRSDLAEFVRQHHVHYDVMPEAVVEAQGRTTVGFEVRLFATIEKGTRALPVTDACRELVGGLRTVAEAVRPGDDEETVVEIERFDPVLYDSRSVPGTDEVAVAVRVSHRNGYARPVDASEERCLKELRRRLRELGIRER